MENNYLLKHQQQPFSTFNTTQWPSTSRMGQNSSPIIDYTTRGPNYYTTGHLMTRQRKNLPTNPWLSSTQSTMATVMTGNSAFQQQESRTMPRNAAPIPPRLARVRSAELLGTQSEPDLRPVASVLAGASSTNDEENTRWFVALFDYSPHMSPNANAQQDELFFRKHQLIKVIFKLKNT